jgi:hypothetical protein
MMLMRIVPLLLLTTLLAHSQPTNLVAGTSPPADRSTVSTLQVMLRSIDPTATILSSEEHDGKVTSMTLSQPTNAPPVEAWAGIYSTKVIPPLQAFLQSLAPTAKISQKQDGSLTWYTCEWPDVTVRFMVDLSWDGPGQRTGMKNWISGLPAGETNTPAVGSLLHQIDATVNAVGSIATPRYDSTGKATALILGLAAKLDGYVFSQYTFYDVMGAKIIGMGDAPAKLNSQK